MAQQSSLFKVHPPRSLERLVEVVWMATVPLRKGERKEVRPTDHGFTVNETFDFPTVEEGERIRGVVKVYDMVMFAVGITPEADALKQDFAVAMGAYPDYERLANGPSYIEIGYNLADYDDQAQQVAIQLIALGDYYGFWGVVTPLTLGVEEGGATELARSGMIFPIGARPPFTEPEA